MAKSKRILVPRTRNAGQWTEAMYFSRIRSLLRRGFMYWRPMMLALKAAERPSKSKTNKRLKFEYQCANCRKWFPRKEIHIDHIIECGELNKYEDIPGFIERLTQEDVNAYQVLCIAKCHKAKTAENKLNKI